MRALAALVMALAALVITKSALAALVIADSFPR
jgi:hypothetical protein